MYSITAYVSGLSAFLALSALTGVSADWNTKPPDERTTTDNTPAQRSSRDVTARQFQSMYMEKVQDNLLRNIWEIDDCRCPRVYMPVCGNDHKTYTNICWLNCRNWFKKSKNIMIHKGPCLILFRPYIY